MAASDEGVDLKLETDGVLSDQFERVLNVVSLYNSAVLFDVKSAWLVVIVVHRFAKSSE